MLKFLFAICNSSLPIFGYDKFCRVPAADGADKPAIRVDEHLAARVMGCRADALDHRAQRRGFIVLSGSARA